MPISAWAHGDPEKILPWDYFVNWEKSAESKVSAFYVTDDNEEFHRLLRGEFKKGDIPLHKNVLVNPEDKDESVDIIFVKEDRSYVLAQYYYRGGDGLTTYFYCYNRDREPFWYLVPPEIFPYGKKDRQANMEILGWHFYTDHFLRYLVYTAYPTKTSRK
jgi:hypothetical protein